MVTLSPVNPIGVRLKERPLGFPVAVLLLCAATLASCAKEQPEAVWAEERAGITGSIEAAKAVQERNDTKLDKLTHRLKEMEKLGQAQQAQIDALAARIAKLTIKHRTTSVKAPATPPALAVTSSDAEGSEKNLYTAAYLALKSGRLEEAAKAFNNQLDLFPDGEYADQAWYWLGETRLSQSLNKSAQHAFKYVVDHHPKSAKRAAAMLKLGQISAASGRKSVAMNYYTRLIKEYSDHVVAEQARLAVKALQNTPVEKQQ